MLFRVLASKYERSRPGLKRNRSMQETGRNPRHPAGFYDRPVTFSFAFDLNSALHHQPDLVESWIAPSRTQRSFCAGHHFYVKSVGREKSDLRISPRWRVPPDLIVPRDSCKGLRSV